MIYLVLLKCIPHVVVKLRRFLFAVFYTNHLERLTYAYVIYIYIYICLFTRCSIQHFGILVQLLSNLELFHTQLFRYVVLLWNKILIIHLPYLTLIHRRLESWDGCYEDPPPPKQWPCILVFLFLNPIATWDKSFQTWIVNFCAIGVLFGTLYYYLFVILLVLRGLFFSSRYFESCYCCSSVASVYCTISSWWLFWNMLLWCFLLSVLN